MENSVLLNMRHNEFGFTKITRLFGPPIDREEDYPYRFHLSKFVKHEPPIEVYSLNLNRKVLRSETNFAIAEMIWCEDDDCWEMHSIGMRYLEECTPELNEWLLNFSHKYRVTEDGELVKR